MGVEHQQNEIVGGGTMTVTQATDRYTIITADSHCGGSHAQYREYLDSKYHDDFDAWRGRYKNPFKDLRDNRRARNWDTEVRWQQQEADGVVAEVLFPNTVPPFFPSFVLFARPPKPEEYEHRLAGIRAHNRWLVDFVAECPERRAGIGQIFVNDIDDAIKDLRFIKKHNLRGGALMPTIPPDVTWLKPLYSKAYDKVWAEMQEVSPAGARGVFLGREGAEVARQAALDVCHPLGVDQASRRGSVEEGHGLAEARLGGLGRGGEADVLDRRANAGPLGPVLHPGSGAQQHPLLGALDIRHGSLVLALHLDGSEARKGRGERGCDQRPGGPGGVRLG
jgi:hypothetical protein